VPGLSLGVLLPPTQPAVGRPKTPTGRAWEGRKHCRREPCLSAFQGGHLMPGLPTYSTTHLLPSLSLSSERRRMPSWTGPMLDT